MKGILKLTYILPSLFIGIIIGGAVSGRTDLLLCGLVLLALDVIVGIMLQIIVDGAAYHTEWDIDDEDDVDDRGENGKRDATTPSEQSAWKLSREEEKMMEQRMIALLKRDFGEYEMNDSDADDANELYEKFERIYARLKAEGEKRVASYQSEEVGRFLFEVCNQMPHAPLPHTLFRLFLVATEDFGGAPAIVYVYDYRFRSMCENAMIILVGTKDRKIRLFALETDISDLVLCEYMGNRHINYGRIGEGDIRTKVLEVLNG